LFGCFRVTGLDSLVVGYKFDADALFLETADGVTLRAPYRTFARIVFRPDYMLFWESFPGFAMHAIPYEAFESKDHERMVRDWLAAYTAAAPVSSK
jgi:hypothetical protein